MDEFAMHARTAAHAADRLSQLKSETGIHGWSKKAQNPAIQYYATRRHMALTKMLKLSPHLKPWAEGDLDNLVTSLRTAQGVFFLPADHGPLIEYLSEHGIACAPGRIRITEVST